MAWLLYQLVIKRLKGKFSLAADMEPLAPILITQITERGQVASVTLDTRKSP